MQPRIVVNTENLKYALIAVQKVIFGLTVERKNCCINCGEEHSTMAMKCSKRKEEIRGRKKQSNIRSDNKSQY